MYMVAGLWFLFIIGPCKLIWLPMRRLNINIYNINGHSSDVIQSIIIPFPCRPKNDVIIIMHIHSRADREMVTCGCGFTLHMTSNPAAVTSGYIFGRKYEKFWNVGTITLLDPRNHTIVAWQCDLCTQRHTVTGLSCDDWRSSSPCSAL